MTEPDIAPEFLRAPFPWFGGKSRAADLIWERFGDVSNYVEPFAGSLAVLLARPHKPRAETVNDLDCMVANFWRALQMAPERVAHWADWPVNEADLHARHLWLVRREEFRERMKTEPEYYDPMIAGWWVWGICQWIGGSWCAQRRDGAGRRPAAKAGGINVSSVIEAALEMKTVSRSVGEPVSESGTQASPDPTHRPTGLPTHELKTERKRPQSRPQSTRGGTGVHGVPQKRVRLGRGERGANGTNGMSHQIPSLGGDGSGSGRGIHRWGAMNAGLFNWFEALAARLRRTRVCCGDWKRILGPSPTWKIGLTGVLLDPPYGEKAGRNGGLYSSDDLTVAAHVRDWAVKHGENKLLRIALCGYEGEHEMPADWVCVPWKAGRGYAADDNENAAKERIWFSPHCLTPQPELFQ